MTNSLMHENQQSLFSFMSPNRVNQKFRDIRNMKYLYDEKSFNCKNSDIQEMKNLGTKIGFTMHNRVTSDSLNF